MKQVLFVVQFVELKIFIFLVYFGEVIGRNFKLGRNFMF